MKRCPDCNGSIARLGHKEKPFLCPSCNKWFSEPEVTPKQTNADRIRSMTDEELVKLFTCIDMFCCPVKEKDCAVNPSCEKCFVNWLKREIEE